MNIVIVGAGDVGYSLAEHLSKQGHSTSIIERSSQICNDINARLEVLVINDPNGSNPQTLERAGIRNADMVIAVTPTDDTNLVVCNFAMQFGVPQRIARIRSLKSVDNNENGVSFQTLGATHVIEPEIEVVENILKYIELPGVTEAENMMGNVYLRGYKITSEMPIAGKTLIETNELTKSSHILIVLIIRNGKAILPRGTEVILSGDEIIAIMRDDSLPIFREILNQTSDRFKKIVISGDSIEAVELARRMGDLADRVVLVDPNEEHAQQAAAMLPDVEVLFGDCTNVEMLQEIRVRDIPFFIAVGNDSEDNIMSCLLAKAEGAHRTLAISNNRRHSKLFQSLGIDYVINPNDITIKTIMSKVIKLPIASLLDLKSVNVQVTRFVIGPKSAVIDLPIKHLGNRLKRSVIIGSILRGEELIIPSGETIFYEDDEVLILSHPDDTREVGKVFKSDSIF